MRRVLCTAGIRKSPAAPLLPGHAGHGLWVFSYVASASCAGCAVPPSSRAGVDARVRFAAAVTRSLLPSAVIFRSFARSGFAASPCTPASRVRQAAASLAPCASPPIARLLWRHGTARCRRTCDYGDSGMSVVAPAVYVGTWHKYTVEASPDAGLT